MVLDLAAERARLVKRGIAIINEGTAPRVDRLFIADPWLGRTLVQRAQLHEGKTA